MANGHKCKDKKDVEVKHVKESETIDDFVKDKDKDKDSPGVLAKRVKRLEKLAGLR